jgi:hypothetical protein
VNDFLNRELDRRELTQVEIPDRPLTALAPEGAAEFDAAYAEWSTAVERWLDEVRR